jgi:hypothetical protein
VIDRAKHRPGTKGILIFEELRMRRIDEETGKNN